MKRVRPILLVLLHFLLIAIPLQVQAAVSQANASLTLDDAVRIGLERSRTLEIARLERDLTGQKIRESWSPVLPQITSDFTYTRSLKLSLIHI